MVGVVFYWCVTPVCSPLLPSPVSAVDSRLIGQGNTWSDPA